MAATLTGPRTRKLSNAEQELYAAMRTRALDQVPYFATIILKMVPVAADGLGTMACDRHWRVYIDFEQCVRWTVPVATGVLIHEANHLLRRHHPRSDQHGMSLDAGIWNEAGDIEINDDLRDCSIPLPDGALYPELYTDRQGRPFSSGLPVEDYYDELMSQAPQQPKDGNGNDGEPNGDGDANDGSGDSADGSGGRGAANADGADGADGAATGACGSGAGGPASNYELDDDHPAFPSVGDTEGELARRKTAQDIQEHERRATAKGRGTVPAGLRRWADDFLAPPKVSWRQLLRSAIRQSIAQESGAFNHTYRRRSRRESNDGYIFPGSERPVVTLGTVIDTSGSMSEDDLHAALSEVEGIATKAGLRGKQHRLMTVDTTSSQPQPVKSAKDIVLTGGGGTDMTVGIDAVAALKPRPNVCVVLTDGFTPWPDEARAGYPRLVVGLIGTTDIIARAREQWPPPEWATVVDIPTDE